MTLLLPGLLLLCALSVAALGLSLTLREVRQRRRKLERHLDLISGAVARAPVISAAEMEESGRPDWQQVFGARLRDAFGIGLARGWGMTAGAPTLLLTGVGAAGIGWLALHSGLHLSTWICAAGTAGMFILGPRALLKRQQSSAERTFMEAFPDAIDMVIRMLRAGLPVTAAIRAVGNEAPPPVNRVFTSIADQMAIGISFEDALAGAGRLNGTTDFRFFAVAIALQRATGGNLTATLDILSDIMRKRQAMRLKARATTGEVRMSAYVLGGIPFFIIGGLLIVTPDYLQPLIADRRGNIIIMIAVLSMFIGFAIIRRMMRSVTQAT